MRKLIILALLGLTTLTYANINIVVSILPQKIFLKAIGGDKVNISLMVNPGNSPHTYEPKPSQMKDIAKADIYFTIGVEYEHTWLLRFTSQNKTMKVIDLSHNIKKMAMKENHQDDDHNEDGLDPHIWTSPKNVKKIAKNILDALINQDIENKKYYINNYNKFLQQINKTDKKIKKILTNIKTGAKFMVFHPSWGYFARDYGLIQFAIESGGKSPKPKHIVYLINEAKEEKVHAIFTAPEFSEKIATQIAKEVGIKVIKVSPLNAKWSENLINLAKAIANK